MSVPSHLGFVLGRRCTARCGICYVHNELMISRGASRADSLPLFGSDKMPTGEMDPERYSQILAAYPSVRTVDVASIGETFDYPFFDDVFYRTVALAPRIQSIGVTSNGSKLDLHQCVLTYPGFLTVSCDSPDPKQCDELRPNTDGERVWRNLAFIATTATRHPGRAVALNMIISRKNFNKIGEMADKLSSFGIRYLTCLRAIHLSSQSFAGDITADEMRWDEPEVREIILAARRRHPEMVIADHFTYFDGGLTTAPEGSGHCLWPETGLLVDADGHGRPCCRIQGPDLGDMLTDNPWEHEVMVRLRKQVVTKCFDTEFAACIACTSRHGAGTAHLH